MAGENGYCPYCASTDFVKFGPGLEVQRVREVLRDAHNLAHSDGRNHRA